MRVMRTIVETETYQESFSSLGDPPPRLDEALAGVMFSLASNPGEVGSPTRNPEIRVVTTVPLNGAYFAIYYWFSSVDVILKDIIAHPAVT